MKKKVMIAMLDKLKSSLVFILCSVWLSFTVAFFAMITSGGEANMELQIGPLFALRDTPAVLFTRGLIGFGLLMLVFFIWRRRIGYILAIVWSVWWEVILMTAIFSTSSFSDLASILVTFFLFIASALFSWKRLKSNRSKVGNQLSVVPGRK